MHSRDRQRLELVLDKITMIEEIVEEMNGIINALENKRMGRPAILMHCVAIAEQISKLKDKEILDESDIKGSISLRNFIAHDYEGVNLSIIEQVIREQLPKLKNSIKKIIED